MIEEKAFGSLDEKSRRFIQASIDRRDHLAREKEERQQRELTQAQKLAEEQRQRAEEKAQAARQLRTRFWIALTFAVVAVLAAIGAIIQFRQARQQTHLQ